MDSSIYQGEQVINGEYKADRAELVYTSFLFSTTFVFQYSFAYEYLDQGAKHQTYLRYGS